MMEQSSTTAKGLISNIEHIFNPSTLFDRLVQSKAEIFAIALTGGAGFLVGFILSRFGNYVLAVFLFLLSLWILDYSGIIKIAIDWKSIAQATGLEELIYAQGDVVSIYSQWMWKHVSQVIAGFVGFLIGLKAG